MALGRNITRLTREDRRGVPGSRLPHRTCAGAGTPPRARRHQRRSPAPPLDPHGRTGRHAKFDGSALSEPESQVRQGWPLGHAPDLPQEVVGHREPFERGACLQLPVKVVGDVAELDHAGHGGIVHLAHTSNTRAGGCCSRQSGRMSVSVAVGMDPRIRLRTCQAGAGASRREPGRPTIGGAPPTAITARRLRQTTRTHISLSA